MNIILCDDDRHFLTSLENKIQQWAQRSGHFSSIMIYSFTSSEDALDARTHGLQFDALFLDIQIPNEMNGLAMAKEVRQSDEHVPIVFITSYGEYAEEGYFVNALRYLRKPITDKSISECLDLIWRRWSILHSESVLLDLPTQIIHLPVKSILYAEVSGHTCLLKTIDRETPWQFRKSMDYIRNKLSSPVFAQCHRSYIVNLLYIRHIANGTITMVEGTTIPIGRKFQQPFMSQFRNFYLAGRGNV